MFPFGIDGAAKIPQMSHPPSVAGEFVMYGAIAMAGQGDGEKVGTRIRLDGADRGLPDRLANR